MPELPTGTVTFLFTDLEASTRMWESHPTEMEAALERHDAILRDTIADHAGAVFSTAGDAFSAAFDSPTAAIEAARSAQEQLLAEPWPQPIELRARMGLHAGEAQERAGDYFGPALNRAARLMSAGHGGQIVVSDVIAGLVTRDGLRDLGTHRLKDLSAAEHLWQVGHADFPALRTLDASPGNLPPQTTSFVGRELEVAELTELVHAHRLVTLTGVGGVGKTCLALQVAAALTDEFPDGVWLVELAPVGDPAAVPDAIAAALSITPQPGLSVTDSIAEALVGRRLLIVLDNCEHVLDAAAEVVEAILASTAAVTLIASSREGLRVDAEQLWPVPSLDVRAGATSPAVELFVERAQAVNPAFAPDGEADTAAVTEICQRLDGIALAIELAAARMVSMSAQDLRDHLGDRFRLLAGSRRGLERHQTLRHAVTWSYDLLDDDERSLLNRCSVFADGFDVAAATHVCGGDLALDEFAVLDLLDSLVRKSLVTVDVATAADLPQLPRLYTAACLCEYIGRPEGGRRLRPGRPRTGSRSSLRPVRSRVERFLGRHGLSLQRSHRSQRRGIPRAGCRIGPGSRHRSVRHALRASDHRGSRRSHEHRRRNAERSPHPRQPLVDRPRAGRPRTSVLRHRSRASLDRAARGTRIHP